MDLTKESVGCKQVAAGARAFRPAAIPENGWQPTIFLPQ